MAAKDATYQYLPSLSLDEYEALRESIRENGVIEPVVVDENGAVIDGHHRVKACAELGVDYPTRVVNSMSEEQKQDLSLELNMHRRHLTREQKKELAVALREQGWTQERIAKVIGVERSTVSRWFVNFHIADQPSPKPAPAEDQEKAELRKQVAYYEDLTRRREIDLHKIAHDHDAKVKARVDAVREDYEKKLAALKGAGIDQEVVERLADEKAAKKIAEAEAKMKAAAEKARELDEDFRLETEQLEADYRLKEKALEEKLESTMQEMSAAVAAKLDIEELERQKRHLEIELSGVRVELEAEKSDAEISRRIRKLMKSIEDAAGVATIVKNQIAASPTLCGLSSFEIAGYVSMFDLFIPAAEEARDILDGLLCGDAHGKGRGLYVVEGSGK
jgi:ParB/RepB/Spo0J family partition protein